MANRRNAGGIQVRPAPSAGNENPADRPDVPGSSDLSSSPLSALFGGIGSSANYVDLLGLKSERLTNYQIYEKALQANTLAGFQSEIYHLTRSDWSLDLHGNDVIRFQLTTPTAAVVRRFIEEVDAAIRGIDFRSFNGPSEARTLYEGPDWSCVDFTKFATFRDGQYLLDCRLARGVVFPEEEFWPYALDKTIYLESREDKIAQLSVSCGIEPNLRAEFNARVSEIIDQLRARQSHPVVEDSASFAAPALSIPDGPVERYQGKSKSGEIYEFLRRVYAPSDEGKPLTLAYLREHDQAALQAFRGRRRIVPVPQDLKVLTDPAWGSKHDSVLEDFGIDLGSEGGVKTARRLMNAISIKLYPR